MTYVEPSEVDFPRATGNDGHRAKAPGSFPKRSPLLARILIPPKWPRSRRDVAAHMADAHARHAAAAGHRTDRPKVRARARRRRDRVRQRSRHPRAWRRRSRRTRHRGCLRRGRRRARPRERRAERQALGPSGCRTSPRTQGSIRWPPGPTAVAHSVMRPLYRALAEHARQIDLGKVATSDRAELLVATAAVADAVENHGCRRRDRAESHRASAPTWPIPSGCVSSPRVRSTLPPSGAVRSDIGRVAMASSRRRRARGRSPSSTHCADGCSFAASPP